MTAERLNIISLVEGCKKNDRKSQHIIYEKFYGKMMGVALRYFKDYDTASDMVQESFIKAFSKINQFEGGENFGGWLKRIVVNHSLDQIRKNKKVSFTSEDELQHQTYEDESEDLSYYSGINMNQILEAVHELSDSYKMVFNLYVLDGLTHKEIANVLGISEGTSKSNYAKAKKKLKTILSDKFKL